MVYIIFSVLTFHCVNGHNLMWLGSVIKKHLNCLGGCGGAGGNSTNEKTQERAAQSGPANPACPRACPSSSPRQLSVPDSQPPPAPPSHRALFLFLPFWCSDLKSGEPVSGPLDMPLPRCMTSGLSKSVDLSSTFAVRENRQLCTLLAGVWSGEVESGAGRGKTSFSLL